MPEVGELYGCLTPLYWDGSKWVKHAKVPAEAIAAGAIAAILEGDYTTWALVAQYDTEAALGAYFVLDGIDNEGRVTYYNRKSAVKKAFIISAAGAELVNFDSYVPAGVDGDAMCKYPPKASLLRKYNLFVDSGYDKISVYNGATKTWERTVDDDKGTYTLDAGGNPVNCEYVAISPSGEWIVVVAMEAGEEYSQNGILFIYKGTT